MYRCSNDVHGESTYNELQSRHHATQNIMIQSESYQKFITVHNSVTTFDHIYEYLAAVSQHYSLLTGVDYHHQFCPPGECMVQIGMEKQN